MNITKIQNMDSLLFFAICFFSVHVGFLFCSILDVSMDELWQNFDAKASDSLKLPSRYARNFLEYCCFRALTLSSQLVGHLGDKSFRRLTDDMMLAWEAPAASNQPLLKVRGIHLYIVNLV